MSGVESMENPIVIRALESPEEMLQAEELQRQVWGEGETDILPVHLLLAVSHHGGVVIGAFDGKELVGLVVGFLGADTESPDRVAMARLEHYSHILGVLPEYRSRGIGYLLKVAQRQAVQAQGVRLITWTYDPLLSLNAQLNIRQLGAVCSRYVQDAYGEMRDALNVGQSSDRFVVDWWITSRRVTSRLAGARKPLDLAHFLSAGAEKVNACSLNQQGFIYPSSDVEYPEGTLALVEIPADIQAIRKADPALAQAWREHTRDIFTHMFKHGYLVTDFVYLSGETYPRSYYLLAYGESTLG
jgi:predicted GNAT superfamily acetyltransferase